MGVRRIIETGQHQPRPSEACHRLLPNQRPILERYRFLRNQGPPNNYLLTVLVDLVALYVFSPNQTFY